MGQRGPSPKPKLEVVREGNVSKKPIREQVTLPPGRPGEPDWLDWLPGKKPKDRRTRRIAREEWRTVVPVLDAKGLLSEVDVAVLRDHCMIVARIAECEADISERGSWIASERGAVKNPSVTAVNQYRTQLRYTADRLGLSLGARARQDAPGGSDGGEDDDPFDA